MISADLGGNSGGLSAGTTSPSLGCAAPPDGSDVFLETSLHSKGGTGGSCLLRSGLLAFDWSALANERAAGGGMDNFSGIDVDMVVSSGVRVVSFVGPCDLNHSLGAAFDVAARLPFSTLDRKSLSW